MARAEPLRLGPFQGGLNTASDPTAVADSELVDCVNFELDIDGSLVSRPPIVETTSDAFVDRVVMIGSAILAGVTYVFASNSNGVWAFDGTTWTLVRANLESRVALQYNNNVYLVATPGSSSDGGRWDGTTFTVDASMPRGGAAVFHKSRMFVVSGPEATVNDSRVTFTDPISSATLSWPGANIIDISPGDGEKLVDIIVYNDNLLLFKQDSTYVLAYDMQPADAINREISTKIGATTYRCVEQYENSVFLYHEGNVYEVVNYDFQRVNLKVPFTFDGYSPSTRQEDVFICTLGDRLLVRYYNRVYVYGLKTRTWSRWVSDNEDLHNFGPLLPFPSNPTQSVNTKYYAGSAVSSTKVFYIQDGYDATTAESVPIVCTLRTKNFDLADSHHFKKMMWWGADILTNQDIQGLASPITTAFRPTWGDLATYTWGQLATRTWGQLLVEPVTVKTDIVDASSASRKFVKFLKTLRFRQIYFQVTLKNDGTTVQGPCRVFTLTAIIGSKQTVPKQVN